MKNSEKKGIMFILDGLGDRPIAELDGKTPLEAAHTPNMDKLLTCGMGGLVDPLIPGVPVDTHVGTAVLLGLSSRDASLITRGPVEAAGAGMLLNEGDVACRCNFANLQREEGVCHIRDRRAGRLQGQNADELAKVLQDIDVGDGIVASVKPATQHRAVLRLSGPNLSAAITDTDPMASRYKVVQHSMARYAGDLNARRTADAINLFIHIAHQRLSQHPLNKERQQAGKLVANGIITRGAGQVFQSQNLLHYMNLKTAIVAGESTILGLGKLLNHSIFTDSSFTALSSTDIREKIAVGLTVLDNHDMVIIHLKAPDICAHDLDPLAKKSFIEYFDQAITMLPEDELVVAVTADHSTDSNTGEHCGDPVPVILTAPNCRVDSCRTFGESSCSHGSLGRIHSTSFLTTMLDYMGRLHNYRPEDGKFYWRFN